MHGFKRIAGKGILNYLSRRHSEDQSSGGPMIVAFWHGGYIPLFSLLRGRDALLLTSDSFRGRVKRVK